MAATKPVLHAAKNQAVAGRAIPESSPKVEIC
jgi:hypothetical protein